MMSSQNAELGGSAGRRSALALRTLALAVLTALSTVVLNNIAIARVFTQNWVPGWAAIFIAVLFVGGIQLLALGIIGQYVGRTFLKVKRRPLYLVEERLGFEDPLLAPNFALSGDGWRSSDVH